MSVIDIAKTISPNCELDIIGTRPGEKIHEQMIGVDDASYTYEYPEYYKILPSIYDWYTDKNRIQKGVKVAENFSYTSDNNPHWMKQEELAEWIDNNLEDIGEI